MKLMLAAALIAVGARTAQAQRCRTLDQIIAACDEAFPVGGLLTLSARGWCYMIGASCIL
jgi:hypothetical protein